MENVETVRQLLRSETAASHARVDELISQHDLTRPEGLAAFLAINHLAYNCVARHLRPHAGFTLPNLPIESIAADLADLSAQIPSWQDEPLPSATHPVGLIYVIAGSKLGGTVLHRRWQQGDDSRVKRAGRFLGQMIDGSCWRNFLEEVSSARISQSEFIVIVESAKACFSIFEAACHDVTRKYAYEPPKP
jgi:heme oxygenase